MQDNQTEMFPEVIGITDVELPPEPKPEDGDALGHPKPAFGPKQVFIDPDDCVLWPYSGRDVEKITEVDLAPLMHSIAASRQQVPVRIRPRLGGTLELISGVRRWMAVQALIKQGHAIQLLAEIYPMTDDAAFRFVAAENGSRSDLKPIERARFYQAAIENHYETGKACADAFGLHKASISRTLDVLRVLEFIGDKVDDHRSISAAQASWLMSLLRDVGEDADPTDEGEDGERRDEVLTAIGQVPAGSAAEVFGHLRQTLTPSHRDGGIDIVVDDDRIVGSVTRNKAGAVRIAIGPEAGAVEVPTLVASIRVALTTLRAA